MLMYKHIQGIFLFNTLHFLHGSNFFLDRWDANCTILANQRVFRNRLDPLDAYNDTEYITRYRVTRVICIELHQSLAAFLDRLAVRMYSISTITQFAVVLRIWLQFISNRSSISSWHISDFSIKMCRLSIRCNGPFAKEYIAFLIKQNNSKFKIHS